MRHTGDSRRGGGEAPLTRVAGAWEGTPSRHHRPLTPRDHRSRHRDLDSDESPPTTDDELVYFQQMVLAKAGYLYYHQYYLFLNE